MRIRAILNPKAGVASLRARAAVEKGRPSWDDLTLQLTTGPGDAVRLAGAAAEAGADLVLAVGGDGTVNEVARGLLGTDVALGIVPVGSGNGLARALGIPREPEAALAALEAGVRRRMDVGLLNGLPFLNVAGVGFDAAVSEAFHHNRRRGGQRGLLGYLGRSLAEIRSYRASPLRLEAGGETVGLTPFVVTFANGPQYGSGAVINPGGRLDDGRLEVVVFADGPLLSLLAAAPRLFFGGLERSARYRRIPAAHATITADAPLPVHRDGDPEPRATRVEVALQPRALAVVVPRPAAEDPAGPFTTA